MFENPPQTPYQATTPTPTSSFNPVSPPLRSSHTRLLIIGTVTIVIGIVVTIVWMTLGRGATPACLDSSDYKTLTGVTLDDDTIVPKRSFYTDYVAFKDDSLSYDETSDESAQGIQLINRLATFYKSHATKSIRFVIDGSYFVDSETARTLAQQRIDTVRTSLVSAGVPIRLITANIPAYSEPEDDTPDENSGTTMTLLSASGCR